MVSRQEGVRGIFFCPPGRQLKVKCERWRFFFYTILRNKRTIVRFLLKNSTQSFVLHSSHYSHLTPGRAGRTPGAKTSSARSLHIGTTSASESTPAFSRRMSTVSMSIISFITNKLLNKSGAPPCLSILEVCSRPT